MSKSFKEELIEALILFIISLGFFAMLAIADRLETAVNPQGLSSEALLNE